MTKCQTKLQKAFCRLLCTQGLPSGRTYLSVQRGMMLASCACDHCRLRPVITSVSSQMCYAQVWDGVCAAQIACSCTHHTHSRVCAVCWGSHVQSCESKSASSSRRFSCNGRYLDRHARLSATDLWQHSMWRPRDCCKTDSREDHSDEHWIRL